MKWWIAGVVLAALLFVPVTRGFVNFYSDRDAEWIEFLFSQKRVVLDRRGNAPHRLIITGGSGVLFGIDAGLVERKLNIPTIDLGTHAGLGFRYIFDRAVRELKPGDTLVVAPEHGTWTDEYRDEKGPGAAYIWTYDRSYFYRQPMHDKVKMFSELSLEDWGDSLVGWYRHARGVRFEIDELTQYNVGTMDRNGALHFVIPNTCVQPNAFPWPEAISPEMREQYFDMARTAQAKGVKIFLTWPSQTRPEPDIPEYFKLPPPWFAKFIADLGMTQLDNPIDNAYPRTWSMDTPQHINQCARRVRTEDLIRRLRPQLGLTPAPEKISGVYLIAGAKHEVTDGNMFLDDPGVVVRYLHKEADVDPHNISPEQVRKLVQDGTPVYCDTDEVTELLKAAHLGIIRKTTHTMPVAAWFAQYKSHVICLAAAPNHPIDVAWTKVVPRRICQRLSEGWAFTAIYGTGPYVSVNRPIHSMVQVYQEEPLEKLCPRRARVLPALLTLESGAIARIKVDYNDVVASVSGVCAVAIDPKLGSVVGKAIIYGGPDVETWHMDQVVLEQKK